MTNVDLANILSTDFPSIKALLIQDLQGSQYIYEAEPTTTKDLRRVASIAKSFTALLVGRKIKYDEEKHLGDIAAVSDYLSKQTPSAFSS